MKRTLLTLLSISPMILLMVIVGCDLATLNKIDRGVGGTPLAATTVQVPTSQPGVYLTVNVPPTTQQVEFHTASDVTAAAGVAVSAVPVWGQVAGGALLLISSILSVFATKQTSALNTANNVIAAAAPGVASLVQTVTKNQALSTGINDLAHITPGIIGLLNHPAAADTMASTAMMTAVAPAPVASTAPVYPTGSPK